MWWVNWPSNGVSYNRNAGLALDADLALFVVDEGISVLMQSCSDPRLEWDAMFLRPTSDVEPSCSDLRLKWDAGLLRPCVRCGVTQTRVRRDAELLWLVLNAGLLRPASEVSVLLWTWGLRFSLKCDLRVEVRFESDDLSLVIFRQPIVSIHTQARRNTINSRKIKSE